MRPRMTNEEKLKEARRKRWYTKISKLLKEEKIEDYAICNKIVELSLFLIDKKNPND